MEHVNSSQAIDLDGILNVNDRHYPLDSKDRWREIDGGRQRQN